MAYPDNPFIGQTIVVGGTTKQCTSLLPNGRGVWQNVTHGNHELRLQELENRTLSANKYGAVGDGVTVATYAIRNACVAANGRPLTFAGGTYIVHETIELKNTGGIVCLGDVVFKASEDLVGEMFVFQEDDTEWLEDTGLLAAPIDEIGEKQVVLTDASGVVPGTELIIWDSADSSFSGHRDAYYAGEFVSVDSITGSTVDTVETMYDAYPVNATTRVYKHTGQSAVFKGFRLESALNTNQSFGLHIHGALGLKIHDVSTNTWGYTAVGIDRCRYVTTIGLQSDMTQLPATGTNYGLGISNSQDCKTLLCSIKSVRHAVAHGGGTVAGAVVTRNSLVQGCDLYSTTTVGAADIHGNCENVRFIGNAIDGGCTLGGHNNVYKDNTIRNWEGASCILMSEPLSMQHTIKDNEVHVFGMAADRGGWFDCGGNTDALSAETTRDGTLTIVDNKIIADGLDEAGVNIFKIVNRGSLAKTQVVHKGNEYTSVASGDAVFRMVIETLSGNHIDTVTLSGVHSGAAIDIEAVKIHVRDMSVDGKFLTKALLVPMLLKATEEVVLDGVKVSNANYTPIYVNNTPKVLLSNVDITEYCRTTDASVNRAGILLQDVAYAKLVNVQGATTQDDAIYGVRTIGAAGVLELALVKFTKNGTVLPITNTAGSTIKYLVQDDIKSMGGVTGTATSANTITVTDGVITNIA